MIHGVAQSADHISSGQEPARIARPLGGRIRCMAGWSNHTGWSNHK